jgi:hypothetical protein
MFLTPQLLFFLHRGRADFHPRLASFYFGTAEEENEH